MTDIDIKDEFDPDWFEEYSEFHQNETSKDASNSDKHNYNLEFENFMKITCEDKKLKEECDVENQNELNEGIFHCDICGKKFGSLKNIQNHIIERHTRIINVCKENEIDESNSSLKCKLCDKVGKTQGGLKIHILLVHTNHKPHKTYTCNICDITWKHKNSLKFHTLRHHTEKNNCNFCEKKFVTERQVKQHEKIHLESTAKPLKCQICGKVFQFHSRLKSHQVFHSNVRSHKCKICPKTYKTKNQLGAHFKRVHIKFEPPQPVEPESQKEVYLNSINDFKIDGEIQIKTEIEFEDYQIVEN